MANKGSYQRFLETYEPLPALFPPRPIVALPPHQPVSLSRMISLAAIQRLMHTLTVSRSSLSGPRLDQAHLPHVSNLPRSHRFRRAIWSTLKMPFHVTSFSEFSCPSRWNRTLHGFGQRVQSSRGMLRLSLSLLPSIPLYPTYLPTLHSSLQHP